MRSYPAAGGSTATERESSIGQSGIQQMTTPPQLGAAAFVKVVIEWMNQLYLVILFVNMNFIAGTHLGVGLAIAGHQRFGTVVLTHLDHYMAGAGQNNGATAQSVRIERHQHNGIQCGMKNGTTAAQGIGG